jgi:nucleotide-binding universal stress UspA family protein
VCAVDGSKNSDRAIHVANDLFCEAGDTLHAVIVRDNGESYTEAQQQQFASTKQKYTTWLAENKHLKGELSVVTGVNVPTTLCAFADTKHADFLVCGADGMRAFAEGKHHFGSTTDALVRGANVDVIVTQVATI